jgi:hypothetical protein
MSNSDLEYSSSEVSDARSDVSILANIVHGSVSNEKCRRYTQRVKDS